MDSKKAAEPSAEVQETPHLKSGSNLERLLKEGKFVVTAELGPPRGADRKVIERKANLLRGYADAFNITDGKELLFVNPTFITIVCYANQLPVSFCV